MANQGTGGRYSKFQLRLRNIRLSRSKKKAFQKENEKYILEKVKEIREVVGVESVKIIKGRNRIAEEVKITAEKEISKSDVDNFGEKLVKGNNDLTLKKPIKKVGISLDEVDMVNEKKDSLEKEEDWWLELSGISKKKPKLSSSKKGYFYEEKGKKVFDNSLTIEEKEEKLKELGTEIILKIKGQFEDHLDELEVLMSELYLLEKSQENELELNKVKEIKKEINQLIQKINVIIEQYNLYKRNYYIDNIVGIDDNVIVDDMITYRMLLNNVSLEKDFVRGYKALDEFKELYQNLDVIREKTISLQMVNEEKIDKFDVRDKKYNEIKLGMIRIDDVVKNCDDEINRQNDYFKDLMSKIEVIDKEEYMTYHMKGIQELVSQSLRYIGFLLLSPLSGLLPGIATKTLITKNLVGNVYQNLHMEEVKHIRYRTIDYDSEISHKLTSVDYTSILIEDTLKDIERLKEDFMLQYDSKIPGYDDTLKKIDKIYHNVIRSQNRVEKIREKLKVSKKLNEKKMVRVKKLNDN